MDECAPFLKDGETPVERIRRERKDTSALLNILQDEREKVERLQRMLKEAAFGPDVPIVEMRELLQSAHCIALRKGENTAWDRFAASIAALGIGSVTARVYMENKI